MFLKGIFAYYCYTFAFYAKLFGKDLKNPVKNICFKYIKKLLFFSYFLARKIHNQEKITSMNNKLNYFLKIDIIPFDLST